jgi:putative membrane protein
MSRGFRLLALLVVLAGGGFGVLFCLANAVPVGLDLVVWQLPAAPLAVWVLAAFILGGLCGLLATSLALVRAHRAAAVLRRQLAARAPAPARSDAGTAG